MKKVLALSLALLMALSLAACGGSGGSSGSSDKVVKIGVYEPQSGDNGAGGKQEILGMQYAHSVQPTVEIGGETYDVELVIVDNESSNDKAVGAASKLISNGVSVVLGSYGSGVSIAASDTFKNAGVPAIGVTCTNPMVTAGNSHYFRACFIDPFQGPVLANYAYGNLGVQKAYCLSKLGDDYSGGLVSYFAEAFEGLGGQVVKAEFPDGNSDFTSYITSAVNEGCGVFFAPTSTEAAQLIINQAASQGMKMPILAGDTWDSNVILEAAKGTDVQVTVTTFYADGTNPDFEASFKEWINSDPTNLKNNNDNDTLAAVSVMGYDSYFLALAAVQDAGSTDPAKVMEALPSVSYDGITGQIAFDENGDAIVKTAYVKTADNATGAWIGGGSVTIDQ
ncbi:ABC transporter substrate-binding protein [Oscillibacter hominis]|uniref:ABC transporter substrate-binding protein n=1 Tax=Oscillibacter hominis TaxID=2763056 RepID=A0A7G9B4I4_9FIRM|nr:ABC transporter substrate-binding protein [Oscillibacter hominis]QNL44465.1 ABC transporter substrate-binding protein [Oscillibacter hominis]